MAEVRTFAFGAFELLPERQLLMRGGIPVRLGGRALDLLVALVERPGELLSKHDLMAHAWPTTTVDESNLKVNIGCLRRALDDDACAATFIATVPGRGYRFIAPVEMRAVPSQSSGQQERSLSLPLSAAHTLLGRRANEALNRDLTPVEDGFDQATKSPRPDSPSQWTRARIVDMEPDAQRAPGDLPDLFEIVGYGIVLDGEITFQIDDTVLLLKPGSVVERRSRKQTTAKLSGGPCRMLFVQADSPSEP